MRIAHHHLDHVKLLVVSVKSTKSFIAAMEERATAATVECLLVSCWTFPDFPELMVDS